MKDIKGWEGKYAITRNGRIWCYPKIIIQKSRWDGIIKRKWKGHWMKIHTTKDRKWYYSIALCQKNRQGFKIHRLIAQAYILNPLNLPEVNHKNGNKGDNRIENLEWCTRKENMKHASKNGWFRPVRGEKHWRHKLNNKKVLEIRKQHANGISARQLGFKYKVSGPTIQGIVKRKYWAHVI